MSIPTHSPQPTAQSRGLFIKICGMTTAAAIEVAANEGVDAVGFVFYPPSKRWIEPAQAARLAAQVPKGILKFAVMLHPEQREVDAVLDAFTPDVLQTDLADLEYLRLPAGLPVLPVLRSGQPLPGQLPARLLFEGPVSGAGTTADWSGAEWLVQRCELILAGGLRPENVAAAVAAIRPFGVDVSSGVESAPGVKDANRIREFIRAARQAHRNPDNSVRAMQ